MDQMLRTYVLVDGFEVMLFSSITAVTIRDRLLFIAGAATEDKMVK